MTEENELEDITITSREAYEKGIKEGRTEVMEEFREIIERNEPLRKPLKDEILKLFEDKVFHYLNYWADIDKHDKAHEDGYRTEWGKGYRQAVGDIMKKLREMGIIRGEK